MDRVRLSPVESELIEAIRNLRQANPNRTHSSCVDLGSSKKIRDNLQVDCLLSLCRVGVRGLELPTSTSRTWRANQLCYTPIPCFRAAKVQHFLQLTIKKLKKLQF